MAIIGYIDKMFTFSKKDGSTGDIAGVRFTTPSGKQEVTGIPINGQPTYDSGHIHTQIIRGKNPRQTRKMSQHFTEGLETIYGYRFYNLRFLDNKKLTAAITYIIDP